MLAIYCIELLSHTGKHNNYLLSPTFVLIFFEKGLGKDTSLQTRVHIKKWDRAINDYAKNYNDCTIIVGVSSMQAVCAIVSASTPQIQGAFVVGGPCQVLEHSSCRGPSAFPPYQGVVVVAAACLRLRWGSVLTYSSRAERTEEGWAGSLYRGKKE